MTDGCPSPRVTVRKTVVCVTGVEVACEDEEVGDADGVEVG